MSAIFGIGNAYGSWALSGFASFACFIRLRGLIPSNVNARALRVPTIALTVTTVYLLAAALVQHATVVPDVQAVVWHTSTPVADADGVKATVPKFSPEIVTDKLPEGAAFDETWKLSAGAAIRSTASVCLLAMPEATSSVCQLFSA